MSTRTYYERRAKKLRTERAQNVPLESSSQVSPQDQQNSFAVITDPLSFYPVLKIIFGFLNDEDLENCCLVSRYWRDVAAPMFSPRYEVELRSDSASPWCPPMLFMIIEMGRYNRKSVKEYTLNFKRVNQTFEQGLRTKKLAISLKVYCESVDVENEALNNFLSKYGPYVKKLTLKGISKLGMSLNEFSNFLHNKSLPNLVSLHCSCLKFVEHSPEEPDFDPNQPHNKHDKLRRICFKPLPQFISQPFGNGKLRKILSMASNLEGIHDLPLWLINEVEAAEKVPALKSVSFRCHALSLLFSQNGMTVLSAFEKLALLQPQLTSWSLDASYRMGEDISMEIIKPLVLSILQNSAASLQSLEMSPTEWYGHPSLPQLKGLTRLILSERHTISPLRTFISERKYLSTKNSLPEIFSNVSEIRISFHLDETFMNRFLPETVISPWGSQIQRLQVDYLFPDFISGLHRLFPKIQHLEFHSSKTGIGDVLPLLGTFYPNLKTLIISVRENYQGNSVEETTLDSAFTGFSKKIVAQLRNQSMRENFTDAKIEGFKSQSTICQLRELKQLTLELKLGCIWKSSDVFTSLSHVAHEFGFKLLRDLKVTLGLRTFDSRVNAIKTPSLEPWAHLESSNVKIVDLYRSSGQW